MAQGEGSFSKCQIRCSGNNMESGNAIHISRAVNRRYACKRTFGNEIEMVVIGFRFANKTISQTDVA